MLFVDHAGDNGVTGSSSSRLSAQAGPELREEISGRLTSEIIGLVGG
jgi:hypothetical protein